MDKKKHLETLQKISQTISQNKSHNFTLKEILSILAEQLGLQRGLITILHKSLGELHGNVWHGMGPDLDKVITYKEGEGITGKVAECGEAMAFTKLQEVPFFLNRSGSRRDINLEELAFICVPIKYYNQVIGTLSVDCSNANLHDEYSLDNELMVLNITAAMIASHLEHIKIERENRLWREGMLEDESVTRIIGTSDPVRSVHHLIAQVAPTDTTVLVTGETGTGKELVAEALHKLSPRKNQPLIKINCGAIPETLIESELFGHEKGSFTGASDRKIGKLEAAHGGTIFLDEIGELPLMAQVKLLRVLQERQIERIGSSKTISIDIRIVAATNRFLEEEVKKEKFRSDLFYRLNVFPIHMPRLRDRGADILLLADHFIDKYSSRMNKKVTRISTAAIDAFMAYHWPGNVRELENCIERAVLLTNENTIRYHDLPPSLQMRDVTETEQDQIDLFRTKISSFENELIIDALKRCSGNQAKAAKLLGTTARVLQYKIQKYNIDFRKFKKKQILV